LALPVCYWITNACTGRTFASQALVTLLLPLLDYRGERQRANELGAACLRRARVGGGFTQRPAIRSRGRDPAEDRGDLAAAPIYRYAFDI
jgi:hypothetical protein